MAVTIVSYWCTRCGHGWAVRPIFTLFLKKSSTWLPSALTKCPRCQQSGYVKYQPHD